MDARDGRQPVELHGCPQCPVERVTYLDVERSSSVSTASRWPASGCRRKRSGSTRAAPAATARTAQAATITRAVANYDGKGTTRAGRFPPNAFGLFDMSGNVWEWTSDDHCAYPEGRSPIPPALRVRIEVIRGGSWYFGADSARCGLRYTHRPQDRGFSLGVRLAHDVE
jgi:formylglycine-generating enzyme required for sulfatase activity